MKKTISIILNVLSIISAVITFVFGVFCAYDWALLADTDYAYTIEFWLVIDYYAIRMLIFSAIGLIASVIKFFIMPAEKRKNIIKISLVAFAIIVVLSIVLYFLPFSFDI